MLKRHKDEFKRQITLFLNSWGWYFVARYDVKDLAIDFLSDHKDTYDLDETMNMIREVKADHGY